MKNKIVFVSLIDSFASKVSSMVASGLSMFFLDLDKFIEYNMFDPEKLLKTCGVEHFKKQEKRIIQDAFQFENMIFYSSFELFSNNKELFDEQNFIVIYIRLSLKQLESFNDKNFVINKLAFEDRDEFLKKQCVVIENSFVVIKNYVDLIKKYLEDKNIL